MKNNSYKNKIYFVRYEDIVEKENNELLKIFNFLKINSSFKINKLKDQFGNDWVSNSSFNSFKSSKISKNKRNNYNSLNFDLRDSITSIAINELKYLKYNIPKNFKNKF